jgi:hypothetical protein
MRGLHRQATVPYAHAAQDRARMGMRRGAAPDRTATARAQVAGPCRCSRGGARRASLVLSTETSAPQRSADRVVRCRVASRHPRPTGCVSAACGSPLAKAPRARFTAVVS